MLGGSVIADKQEYEVTKLAEKQFRKSLDMLKTERDALESMLIDLQDQIKDWENKHEQE